MLVDESNVGSSVRSAGRGLDWLKLRDFLAGPGTGLGRDYTVFATVDGRVKFEHERRDKKRIRVIGSAEEVAVATQAAGESA